MMVAGWEHLQYTSETLNRLGIPRHNASRSKCSTKGCSLREERPFACTSRIGVTIGAVTPATPLPSTARVLTFENPPTDLKISCQTRLGPEPRPTELSLGN